MPRLFNTHVEAETGAELRGWGYRKVADAAALAALTDQVVGEVVTRIDTGRSYQWSGSQWDIWTTDGTVAREDISGAATFDVTGHDAAELTLTGATTALTLLGWDTDTSVYQKVRIEVRQDATGGHTFDWGSVSGTWLESLPAALDTTPSGTSLQFYAITTDGGATVWLEPIGIQYSMDCVYLQVSEIDVPAVAANGVATFGHSFQLVSSVELIDVATGRRVLADWWQTPGQAGSAVNIDFTAAHAAGAFTVRIAGLAASPCELTVSTSEWVTINLALVNAPSVNPRVDFVGPAGSVQWVWGDGSLAENAVTATTTPHTYAPNFTGSATLRYRKGTQITRFTDTVGRWAFDAALLPSTTTHFIILNGLSAITGNVANLPSNLQVFNVLGQNTVGGSIDNAPSTLTTFSVGGLNSISGTMSNFSAAGLVTMSVSGSNTIGGDIADTPATVTNLTLTGNTTLTGDIANAPAGLTNLTVGGASSLSGDLANLPAGLLTLNISGTGTTINGLVDNLPAGLTTYRLSGGANTTAGDVANLPAGLTAYTNAGNNAVGGSVGSLPAALTAFTSDGASTVTGDIGALNPAIEIFSVQSAAETTALTTAFTPGAGFDSFIKTQGSGLTSGNVDSILVAFDALGTNNGTINIGGTNAAPSAAGSTAAANLTGRGWTVTTN